MNTQEKSALWRMVLFSGVGVVAFFVPFELGGKNTILFDHAASWLVKNFPTFATSALFAMMIYGVADGFRAAKKDNTQKILSFFKCLGLAFAVLYVSRWTPPALEGSAFWAFWQKQSAFLYEKLCLSLAMIIPVGALVLACLIGFGLLEMVGVLMQPLMRRVFKTPGYAAIDAVASFVGSYSVGLLLTDQMYRNGRYSTREAVIIATGFSTVSAAFMVVVAKTLNLMSAWNVYFWSALIITFAVTAITARIPPIARMPQEREEAEPRWTWKERRQEALRAGLATAQKAAHPLSVLAEHFWAGIQMAAAILPSIMAIGMLGLLLNEYTPLFKIIGLLLYPFTLLLGSEQALNTAQALASSLAEMFLPAILLKGAALDVLSRYVVAVVSVSSIIFFSGLVPCILATRIPLKIRDLLLIWLQRTVLSIVLAILCGRFALSMGWLA